MNRFLRFKSDGKVCSGVIEGSDAQVQLITGCFWGEWKKTGETIPLADVKEYLPPIEMPTKVLGLGLNYRDHAEEGGHMIPEDPITFFVAQSALTGHGCPVVYPNMAKLVEYESELAVVIGKEADHVSKEDAMDYVFGYTIVNDVSARDIQRKDKQWSRGKSFKTFKPTGPWIVTGITANANDISMTLNGEVTQKSNTSNLIFDIPTIIEVLTKTMILYPGDIIMTGTPGGVKAIHPGDTMKIEISGIGTLENTVVAE